MALKLADGVKVHGRTDATLLDPRDLLANFPAFTGRVDRKPEDIAEMVQSLLAVGQLQPVVFRKSHDGQPVPVAGCTRILAAVEITNRRLIGSTGTQYGPDNPFLISGLYRQMNETDALFVTISENDTRTPMSPMDYAFCIRTASEGFGLSDVDIAKRLGKDAGWVGRHRSLLDLDDETRQMVSDGTLAVAPAVNVVAHLEPSLRPAVIERARSQNGGRATSAALQEAAQALGAGTGKKQKRSEKEWNSWLKSAIEDAVDGNVKDFLLGMQAFRSGEIDAYGLDDLLRLI